MTKIKAILFDLDGTLRDTRDLMYTSMQTALEQHTGKRPTREDISRHVHHHSEVHKAFAGEVPFDEFERTFFEHFEEGRSDIKLYDKAKELLDNLRQSGLRLAVVTSARTTKSTEFVARHKLDEHFEVVSGVQEGVRPKPAPDLVLRALEHINCIPNEAIMVGDLPADVTAAHAAGVRCIAITHGFGLRSTLKEAGADYIIDSLMELPAAIETLEKSGVLSRT